MRVAILTMGKDDDLALRAVARHSYDRLVVLLDHRTEASNEFQMLQEFENANSIAIKPIIVDPNDLMDCYNKLQRFIARHPKDELFLNISAGTKLLSAASILCAFNHGIPAYHFTDKGFFRLPVFRDMSINERYPRGLDKLILELQDESDYEDIIERMDRIYQIRSTRTKNLLGKMRNQGLITTTRDQGKRLLSLTEQGSVLKEYYQDLCNIDISLDNQSNNM